MPPNTLELPDSLAENPQIQGPSAATILPDQDETTFIDGAPRHRIHRIGRPTSTGTGTNAPRAAQVDISGACNGDDTAQPIENYSQWSLVHVTLQPNDAAKGTMLAKTSGRNSGPCPV